MEEHQARIEEHQRNERFYEEQFASLEEKLADDRCLCILERSGDVALSSGKYEKAIAYYSSVLCLNPTHPVDILVKRSKARASKELWEDALTDAVEVRVLCCLWLH